MSANCDVIVIFLINGQFGAIRKPDFERIACKCWIFININLILKKSYKNLILQKLKTELKSF